MSSERLIYLPLGGAGEIGMNAYVYGYGKPGQERLILVDLGVTFPDMDSTPGVDLILPDITWLAERRDRLEAIIVTHAHEDHVGAVAQYHDRLRAPVYARGFTANILRRKMKEMGHPETAVSTAGPWPETVQAGPFSLGFVPVSHSIPECSSIVIDTPEGRLIHTGDFKIDLTPGVGEPFDHDMWAGLAEPGVKALICDSTNVFNPHEGRSEASVGAPIEALVTQAKGLFVCTTFASNVARVKTLAEAGERAGRSVCLMGRAMQRMVEVGQETGVLKGFPRTVPPEEARSIPRENLMLIVTGSQGERRAASAQLAAGKYQGISMKEGDTVLFSSKTIPGNERGVIRIINQFSELGVDVIEGDDRYHVSGHANRPDLEVMHALLKPQIVIPMHGEHRHLREHVKMCDTKGIKGVLAVNGMMVDLSGNAPKVADYIETGRTYLDGSVKVGALDGVVRDRIRMALNGHVMINVILDEDDAPLGEAWCEIMGLAETGRDKAPLVEVLEADLGQFLGRADGKMMADDDKLEEGLRRVARQTVQGQVGKKPEVTVVISRMTL